MLYAPNHSLLRVKLPRRDARKAALPASAAPATKRASGQAGRTTHISPQSLGKINVEKLLQQPKNNQIFSLDLFRLSSQTLFKLS
jgi:hypothetical protein